MLISTVSTHSVDFLITVAFSCGVNGECNSLVKIDFNGTVQDYVSFAKYSSNSGTSIKTYCDVFDSSGNAAIHTGTSVLIRI